MKNIIVTGAFGYVGSRLTPHLLKLGHRVHAIDLCLYGKSGLEAVLTEFPDALKQGKLKFSEGDIRSPGFLDEALIDADAIIHLAAISNDPTGEIDEVLTRQTNFDAVALILAKAKKCGVKRFINISSSSVFGIKHEKDVTETLEPEPITHYSKYKMLSEGLVLAAASHDFCAVNVRPATICGYSPRQRLDLTVNKLTADAVIKRKITVDGGEQRRPNVSMTDILNLYGRLVDTPSELLNGRTFNFGFQNLKVIEIARLIQNELKDLDVKIEVNATKDLRDYHISASKLARELNYEPVSSIQEGVAELRRAIENGMVPDIDSPKYYNMKSMNLQRSNLPYEFFGR